MTSSTVYFTDMRCKVGTSLLAKLDKLILAAGIGKIDFKDKYVAIKIHFGEPGNLAFLRPNFARVVADRIKALGGKPFLTDSNTLYVGGRGNALDHLHSAALNGYSELSTGCQNIIADGVKGTDEVEVPIEGGVYCKTALIGRAVMDADIVISLNHFKGHELTGFGGAIKNLGMGSGSRAGKMKMHCAGKPEVDPEACVGCRFCERFCNQKAFSFDTGKAVIDHDKCVGCGRCIGVCNAHAIEPTDYSGTEDLNYRMTEYCKAVVDGRPHFHISVVNQVSPYCDCHGESDAAVVPDIGIFASADPVAIDKACIDAVNAAPAVETSILSERGHTHGDHFTDIHPATDWRFQISHAEKIGLGSGKYELVTVK
ncbi:4Fe-4S ferredoxin [Synergistales bacterium]|nr:4Fe-4S ferredoxin [Synergistales bacterium]